MNNFPEKDWKRLRSIQKDKLALVCGRILDETGKISQEREGGEHQAFLNLWTTINQGNSQVAELFDDIRRSTALQKLIAWKRHGLLSDEELALFTEETQAVLRRVEDWLR
jgi:hypothetical protein